ncbi:MAG: hypothetical protein ACOZBL_02080 [Patescibacteria group bacterium]
MTVITITPGKFGNFFFETYKKPNHNIQVINATMFVLEIFFINSTRLTNISLCCTICKAGSFNQSAAEICHKAIVTQTEIKNQCNTVDGKSVIYFVIFKRDIKIIIIQLNIAKRGRYSGQCTRANESKIDVRAQATPKIL